MIFFSGKWWWRTHFCYREMTEPLCGFLQAAVAGNYDWGFVEVGRVVDTRDFTLCFFFWGQWTSSHKICMEYEQNDFRTEDPLPIFSCIFFMHVSLGCGIFLGVKLCQPNPHKRPPAKNGFSKNPRIEKGCCGQPYFLGWFCCYHRDLRSKLTNDVWVCFDVCLEPEWWKLFENLQKQANMSCWWSCFWLRSMKPCTDAMFFLKHFSSCGVPLPLQETSTFTTKVTKVSLMYPDANAWWMNALFSLCLHSIPGELNNNFLMSLFSSSRCIYIYII